MDDLLYQMGKCIASRRNNRQMKQEELAEAANVMPRTVSTAELGKKALRTANIVKSAQHWKSGHTI